ncbi:MAG: hypothetical protein ACERKJ_10610, partial [Candidatus Dadabacteria bacterium]
PKWWTSEKDALKYMAHIGLTIEEIERARESLKNHKFRESTLWQKIKGYIYWTAYDMIHKELTWENVAYILTNLDKLMPLMPSGFTAKLLLELDKLAEKWHASFQKK